MALRLIVYGSLALIVIIAMIVDKYYQKPT